MDGWVGGCMSDGVSERVRGSKDECVCVCRQWVCLFLCVYTTL